MAQMFRFERNGVVKLAELIEQNDKAKTVTLKMEDGTFKATSLSTFKRWWKPCDDVVTEQEQPEEEAQQEQGVVDAEKKEEVEPVSAETEKKAVKKVKKAKKEKVDNSAKLAIFNGISDYIEQEATKARMTFYVREKQPNFKHFRPVNATKVCFNCMTNRKAVIINTKRKFIGALANIDGMVNVNHNFDIQYRFENELTEEDKALVTKLIKILSVLPESEKKEEKEEQVNG